MGMSKKDFIALADSIREHNRVIIHSDEHFTAQHLDTLASFCKSVNSNFKRERWLSYIAGECGPNGGDIKGRA